MLRSFPAIEHPSIVDEPSQRPLDPLAYRQSRAPSEGPDARRVQEDERIVAGTAAIAAGIIAPGRETETGGDPGNRVIDLAILIGPEIEDIHLVVGMRHRVKNRVQAILNVKI